MFHLKIFRFEFSMGFEGLVSLKKIAKKEINTISVEMGKNFRLLK